MRTTNETIVICAYCDKTILPEEGIVVMMYKEETFCDEHCMANFECEAIDAHR